MNTELYSDQCSDHFVSRSRTSVTSGIDFSPLSSSVDYFRLSFSHMFHVWDEKTWQRPRVNCRLFLSRSPRVNINALREILERKNRDKRSLSFYGRIIFVFVFSTAVWLRENDRISHVFQSGCCLLAV